MCAFGKIEVTQAGRGLHGDVHCLRPGKRVEQRIEARDAADGAVASELERHRQVEDDAIVEVLGVERQARDPVVILDRTTNLAAAISRVARIAQPVVAAIEATDRYTEMWRYRGADEAVDPLVAEASDSGGKRRTRRTQA